MSTDFSIPGVLNVDEDTLKHIETANRRTDSLVPRADVTDYKREAVSRMHTFHIDEKESVDEKHFEKVHNTFSGSLGNSFSPSVSGDKELVFVSEVTEKLNAAVVNDNDDCDGDGGDEGDIENNNDGHLPIMRMNTLVDQTDTNRTPTLNVNLLKETLSKIEQVND